MLFNSYIFILLFLPLTLFLYFGFHHMGRHTLAKVSLLLLSLLFYGYFNYSYLFIILASICINFTLSKFLNNSLLKISIRKAILMAALLLNVGMIFYFKYFDFMIANINSVFKQTFEMKNILLPLGISFFTFQQISYIVDSYRGETKDYSFLEYAVFVSFFPQLVAGPIILHSELIPQFQDKTKHYFNHTNFANGLYQFSIGLFKKVIVADTFGKAVLWGFGDGMLLTMTQTDAIIVMISYTFQIYFDFSGYCDMASGIASMLNITLPVNFNSPYKATSILDFWNRWHMTLTKFLRQYVYFPLGGSKKGNVRTYSNILLVYLISGIWHGANWTFILWGMLHGIASVLTRLFKKPWNKMHQAMQWLITFGFLNLTWLIFRADSINDAFLYIKRMFTLTDLSLTKELAECFRLQELDVLISHLWKEMSDYISKINGFYMWALLGISLFAVLNLKNCSEKSLKTSLLRGMQVITCLVWSIISLSGISTFLYFNF